VDSFRESMDSFQFDSSVFKKFVSRIRFVMPFSKDSFRGFVSWRHFQKIRFADSFCDAIFKIFDESYESNESSQILSTIGYTNPSESFGFRFANPLVFKRFVSWIRFVLRRSKDSFRGFVSWCNFQKIHFVMPKISNYSIRFVSEGFVYESRILKLQLIRTEKSFTSYVIKIFCCWPLKKVWMWF
jgi:hypothetical protein